MTGPEMEALARTVRCPHCEADVDRPCVVTRGEHRGAVTAPHTVRIVLASDALEGSA